MENQNLQRQERSNALIAIVTNLELSRDFERSLSIKKIIKEAVPMIELKRVVGSRQVAVALDIQLTRLVGNLNLKWSLNDAQIKTIVEDLMDKYPNECLEDFILCFKKARMGEYGELIRLDSPIVFSWMQLYLDEKYKAVEDDLLKQKDEYYKTIIPDEKSIDRLQEWKEVINKAEGFKNIPQLTEEEINEEGKEKPKRKVYHYNESEAQIALREAREKLWVWQELTVRERHPDWTEEEIKFRCDELKETTLYEDSRPKHILGIEKIWRPKKNKS